MIVEVIARQVGEAGSEYTDAVGAPLIEALRGNLQCNVLRALINQVTQTALQGEGVGGRVGSRLDGGQHAATDGADVAAGLTARREGGGDQPGSRGLAVGAGDSEDPRRRRRLAVGAIRQQRKIPIKARDGQGAGRTLHREAVAAGGIEEHGDGAGRDGGLCMLQPVTDPARQSDEGVTGTHRATVHRQPAHRQRTDAEAIGEQRRQIDEAGGEIGGHGAGTHGSGAACTRVAAGTCARSSGGTAIRRSAPERIAENTGADT